MKPRRRAAPLGTFLELHISTCTAVAFSGAAFLIYNLIFVRAWGHPHGFSEWGYGWPYLAMGFFGGDFGYFDWSVWPILLNVAVMIWGLLLIGMGTEFIHRVVERLWRKRNPTAVRKKVDTPLPRSWLRIHLSTGILLMFVSGFLLWANFLPSSHSCVYFKSGMKLYTFGWPIEALYHPWSDQFQIDSIEASVRWYTDLDMDSILNWFLPNTLTALSILLLAAVVGEVLVRPRMKAQTAEPVSNL